MSKRRFYTVDEVAEILPIAPNEIRVMCRRGPKAGGFKAAKHGTKWLIPVAEIDAWEQRNTYHPAAA